MNERDYLIDVAVALAMSIMYVTAVFACVMWDSRNTVDIWYHPSIEWKEHDVVLPPEQDLKEETKAEIAENIQRLMDADYEEYYAEPYTQPEYSNDAVGFKEAGVVYDEAGTRYTWYSQNVLPGGGLDLLNGNGRSVNDEGLVVDEDGYVAVASSDYPIGTVLDTPFGEAKVYDTGCASGTVDVYTNY